GGPPRSPSAASGPTLTPSPHPFGTIRHDRHPAPPAARLRRRLDQRRSDLPRPAPAAAGGDAGGAGHPPRPPRHRRPPRALGAAVAVVSCVGRDAFGEQALENYRGQGVDTAHVRVAADRPTGVAAILVDAAAQNCIVVVAGANGALTPADVRSAAGAIASAD